MRLRLLVGALAAASVLASGSTACSGSRGGAGAASTGSRTSAAGGSGGTATPATPDGEVLTASSAQGLLDGVLDQLAEDGSGWFHLTALIGPGGQVLNVDQTGQFDLVHRRWMASQSVRQGNNPSAGTLSFVGTTKAAFVTSSEWQGTMRGRWLRFTQDQFTQSLGNAGRPNLSSALPEAVIEVLGVTARSGHSSPGVTVLDVDLPATAAFGLTTLKTVLIKRKIDPKSIGGVVRARLTVSNDQRLQSLEVATGAMTGFTGVPSDVAQLAKETSVLVQFDHFGVPVVIRVPTGKQIIPPSEARP